ncbi:MAG: transposase [Pseudomonadota bacterium]
MDTSDDEPGIAQPAKRSWRRHSVEFRSRVIELARRPNTSVAAVALANGLNANMLRRWVREADPAAKRDPGVAANDQPAGLPAFVPVALPDDRPPAPRPQPSTLHASAPSSRVAVEIRRGSTSVHAELPLDERSAAWLREVLG